MHSGAEGVADAIYRLTPRNDFQKSLKADALKLTENLLQIRWLMLTDSEPSVPLPFLVILVFWLTIIFVSFGLFAPLNLTVLSVLFVCALSVASALFFILEMEEPFHGLLTVSEDAMRFAYAHLNR
jgi:hypothetical protein